MSYKIVADSSASLQGLEGVAYASVPLKIVTAEKEYVDDAGLDTVRMLLDVLEEMTMGISTIDAV